MKSITNLTTNYKIKQVKQKKPPNHETAAAVEEIIKAVGDHKIYNFGFWLRKVKSAGKSYTDILAILKDLEGLPSKYNKGATLTNILCKKKNITQ